MVSFIREFPLKLLNYHIWRLTHAVDGDIYSFDVRHDRYKHVFKIIFIYIIYKLIKIYLLLLIKKTFMNFFLYRFWYF